MIVIRGQKITVQPLSLAESGQVYASLMVLKACIPPEEMLRPENHEHLLTVIAQAVRRHVPDVTHEEIAEGLDMASIGPVLLALSGASPMYTHQEIGHV